MLQFMGSQNSVQVLGGTDRHRHKTALQYLSVRYIQLPMIYIYNLCNKYAALAVQKMKNAQQISCIEYLELCGNQ